MNEVEKKIISEKAYKDYVLGMKYKDIAEKYNVSINTVRSWQKRFAWSRKKTSKRCAVKKDVQELGNNFIEIKDDMMNQLKEKGIYTPVYIDLVETYMALYNVKNRLIEDIEKRGVAIEWSNGSQNGIKKNDSTGELNKTVAQMTSLLNDLTLKPSPKVDDDDDI